jgi:mannose-6-phosphate isomerase-like protein (cupin superfamily)
MEMFNLAGLATKARLNARGKTLAAFDGRTVGISRFSAHPRWEMHPHGDEFLQVIEGELELALLLAKRTERTKLHAGEAVIVPKGVWHSPLPRGLVSLLHIADYRSTKVSDAEDPRTETPGR